MTATGKYVKDIAKRNPALKRIIVGYEVFEKAVELAQEYRIQQDKLSGPIVAELDTLLNMDDSVKEGSDYFYFSIHGLKGASFAWQKTGNACSFRVISADEHGNGQAYVGRTYYLVTMKPVVIMPSAAIEVLAHARSGANNDKFFTSVLNDMKETSDRMKQMQNPGPGQHRMLPGI